MPATRWTEQEFDDYADRIALAVWDATTGNGRDLPEDLWNSHRQNCHAAAVNTWTDDISPEDWHAAALARMTR